MKNLFLEHLNNFIYNEYDDFTFATNIKQKVYNQLGISKYINLKSTDGIPDEILNKISGVVITFIENGKTLQITKNNFYKDDVYDSIHNLVWLYLNKQLSANLTDNGKLKFYLEKEVYNVLNPKRKPESFYRFQQVFMYGRDVVSNKPANLEVNEINKNLKIYTDNLSFLIDFNFLENKGLLKTTINGKNVLFNDIYKNLKEDTVTTFNAVPTQKKYVNIK